MGGRYKNVPLEKRTCPYCSPSTTQGTRQPPVPAGTSTRSAPTSEQSSGDTELHFRMQCPTFKISRRCFYGKFSSLDPNFKNLEEEQMFLQLLCPRTAQQAKLTNKFIKIMLDWRETIDDGISIDNLGFSFVN